jgi:hypothetical protein
MPGCARGCVRPGRHLRTCLGGCPGCLPRSVDVGRLCHPCGTVLGRWFTAGVPPPEESVPWVIGWLAVTRIGWPWHATDSMDVISGSPDPPAPVAVGLLDATTALRDQLTLTGHLLCAWYGLTGPDEWDPIHLTRWLSAHLYDLAGAPFIGPVWDGLARAVAQAHVIAPWRPPLRFRDGVPCPECQATALASEPDRDDRVVCLECRNVMDAARYERWLALLHAHYRPAGPWRETTPVDWVHAGRRRLIVTT